jgi:hypothetical protein
VIVVLRHYLVRGVTRYNAVAGAAALIAVMLLFVAAQFYGAVPVPESEFVSYLRQRMADPSQSALLSFSYIWYQPLSQEIHDTWARMPSNLLGIPVYALLVGLHAPLWRYFAALIGSLSNRQHRWIVIVGIALIALGYLIIFAIVFDYSRWISNWAVCMFLILHAVKALPASQAPPPIRTDDRRASILGWIVTLIPRVGIVRPF